MDLSLIHILTYGKSDSVATIWSEAFCQKNHIHLDYAQSILMVDNYLPSFDMEEEILIDKKTDAQIQIAKENIEKRMKFIPEPDQAAKDLYAMASKRFAKQMCIRDRVIGATLNMTMGIKVSSLMVEEGYGYASDASMVIMLLSLGSMISGFLFGKLYKILKNYILSVGFIITAIAMIIIGLSHTVWMSVLGGFLVGFGFRVMMPTPVSYTHLDVYKRQPFIYH